MKIHKYSVIALSTLVMLYSSGCQKQLDIKPVDQVEQNDAIKTSKDVQGVLIGAYTAATLRGLYGGRLQSTTDFLADDGDFSYFGTFNEYTELSDKAVTIVNQFVEGVWDTGYNTIGVCNNVLAHIDLVDEVNKKRVEGEARFLRGMVYFDLVKAFGRDWNDTNGSPTTNQGVPIVLTPTTTIAGIQKVSRNTVAEVYAQAIADLKVAEANLDVSNGVYATSGAASAVLARIYLQQKNYAEAETEASKVIASGRYSLIEHFADEFQYPGQATHVFNTAEDIFAVQISNQSGFNALNEVYAAVAYGGREETYVNDQHFARYESGDTRADMFFDDDGEFTTKFNNLFGNVVVIRFAEMYLIRAEARSQKASPDYAGAAADLNVVRKRAGISNIVPATSAAGWIDVVERERRVELPFEGFRLADLKRYKKSTNSVDGDGNVVDTFPWNSPKLIFPIPKRERDANPNLTQNEGYQ
ncbi:RagB/SusD family nutrient uptake outer membrane protein [Mucilaginibacter sp. CAU 1740]|uniref:RagB/SusD family nutrient uptake outer membrane protein n=1 Tax=Mucilaginibacter sp. CAU 1740 TaxID=3140365 RepID=UPI00325B38D2